LHSTLSAVVGLYNTQLYYTIIDWRQEEYPECEKFIHLDSSL